MIKKEIPIGNRDIREIVGYNDTNLKAIRRFYPDIRLYIRDNAIVVEGEEGEVEELVQVFDHLLKIYDRYKRIEEWDVADAIHRVRRQIGKEKLMEIVTPKRKVIPHTPNQQKYLESIEKHDVVFGIGPAGTGKTFLAVAMAVKYLRDERVERIILTRPAVEAGESLGYLPGTFEEKISPYLTPLYDALFSLLPGERVNRLIENRVVEIAPLAYMRGRTLSEAFIILDEAQNTTIAQMKMFLTRLGLRSKVVITGDITQIDLPRNKKSGLVNAIEVLKGIEGIDFVYFDKEDVVRHPLVKRIIEAYEKHSD